MCWGICVQEVRRKNIFETDRLAAALTNADKVKMNVQKGYVTKDISGPFSSTNPSISVAAPKPFPSNMASMSVLLTKTTSFT